jgi:hypothetical protein
MRRKGSLQCVVGCFHPEKRLNYFVFVFHIMKGYLGAGMLFWQKNSLQSRRGFIRHFPPNGNMTNWGKGSKQKPTGLYALYKFIISS